MHQYEGLLEVSNFQKAFFEAVVTDVGVKFLEFLGATRYFIDSFRQMMVLLQPHQDGDSP